MRERRGVLETDPGWTGVLRLWADAEQGWMVETRINTLKMI